MKGYVTGRNLKQGQGPEEEKEEEGRRGQGKNKFSESVPILADKVSMPRVDFPAGLHSRRLVASHVTAVTLWRHRCCIHSSLTFGNMAKL